MKDEERKRLASTDLRRWRKWGPYLAERAWGTVREDYSESGNAWAYLTHDHARSKAYRWGEDGIAGFCDRYQILCFSLAMWNEQDPILKERLYGVVPGEGNHGEDVKELYYYVDAVPTHAYQRMLYKYPHARFPYEELVARNRARGGDEPEVEIIDTGVFDDGRYFDVEIEIAKADPDDIAIVIRAHNRGKVAAPIQLVPQLWFRNVWAWNEEPRKQPQITRGKGPKGTLSLRADDSEAPPLEGVGNDTRLGAYRLHLPEDGELLFTDNESNAPRLYGSHARARSAFVKDAFHRFIVDDDGTAVNPEETGTKACARYRFDVPPGESVTLHLRLLKEDSPKERDPLASVARTVAVRREEANAFYAATHPPLASDEEKAIQRQALAGMLWSKQAYFFDVHTWLDGDNPKAPPPEARKRGRNRHWMHLNSMRVLSMPDTWEYPWFAAWDLAFHAITFALVDGDFAKEQLWLLLFEQFQHPNGQIPAYEWEFSDLNPPVHAWAVWRVYNMDRITSGTADRAFLERCFHKLLLNFTWWVNKVDREGNNVFEGGFLGLDNIAVIDRSEPLPDGAVLQQSDATGWMGMFSLVMMRIALELARENRVYESLATKFFEHYAYIGAAMKKLTAGGETLWNDEDGFFYDLISFPNGAATSFRVRSLVGLIPLYAVERLERAWIEPFSEFSQNLDWFLANRPDLVRASVSTVTEHDRTTHVLSVVDRDQLKRLLVRVADKDEFLSPYGLRSMSKWHDKHPFSFAGRKVHYEPREAETKIKGGNSNWRGPIWFPTSFLMIESLRKLEKGFGSKLHITFTEERTGEAGAVSLTGLAGRLANRMIALFEKDDGGYRPIYGPKGSKTAELYAKDPHFKDLLLFHEYFHGDSGEGLGASHQTGWTGLVANLIDEWRR